jgi:hypothetical protein
MRESSGLRRKFRGVIPRARQTGYRQRSFAKPAKFVASPRFATGADTGQYLRRSTLAGNPMHAQLPVPGMRHIL